MTAQRKRARALALALAAAFGLHAVFATSLWQSLRQAAALTGVDYATARAAMAFQKLPIDDIAIRLDRMLEPGQAVALGGQLNSDEFLKQRFTEGLYPRPIDAHSRYILDLSDSSSDGAQVVNHTLFGGPLNLRLLGPAVQAPTTARPAPSYDVSAFSFLFCALGACGLGWALLAAARVRLPSPLGWPGCVLAGALAIAAVASLASWFQLSPPRLLPGTLGCLLLVILGARRLGAKFEFRFTEGWRRPENYLIALFFAALFYRFFVTPITLWDGRSIWFFHGRQLFTQGFISRDNLTNAQTLWSHPDYPLLYPGWLAYFGGFGALFNERQAALGAGLLLTAASLVLWILARRRLGRWPGSAFAALLVLATDHVNLGGYADGLLLVLVVSAALAFLSELAPLAWGLLAAASLLKAEGVILALAVAGPLLIARRAPLRSYSALLVFLPAFIQKGWTRAAGADSLFKDKSFSDAIRDFFPRLGEALTLAPQLLFTPGYTQLRSLLWDGLAGILALAALWLVFRAPLRRTSLALALSATLLFLFGVASISLLPEDVSWFVGTALDRLLTHPAALLALGPLFYLSELNETTS